MPKFTQGKWYWQKGVLLSHEKIILGAMLMPPLPANARLIAAAPEMYELLHDYVYNFEYGRDIEIYPEARELLARIDGEEEE